MEKYFKYLIKAFFLGLVCVVLIGQYNLYKNQVMLLGSLTSRELIKQKVPVSGQSMGTLNSQRSKPANWIEVQQRVKNTVVQVLTTISRFNWLEPYKTPTQEEAGGSGFFINEDGYVLTNYHVVAQAKTIEIRLPSLGQERFEVEVVGASPERDIALLKLKIHAFQSLLKKLGGSIPYLALGDSDAVTRAQDIMALGYPLAQPNLKSTIGNVSGLERLQHQSLIQITAPLNPGNSGGPSLNLDGEVIGVNSSGIIEAQNVGYVIPINEVKSALNDLYKVKLLRKPTPGCIFTPATDEMIKYFGNPANGGWYISRVFKNTIFEKVGVKDGDMLYEVNGYKIDTYGDIVVPWTEDKVSLMDLLNRFVVGDQVRLVIYRRGERLDISFKLEPRFLLPIRRMYPEFEKIDYEVIAGMCVMEMSINHVGIFLERAPHLAATMAKYLRPEHQYEPVLVITNIFPDSPAKKTKALYPGSIIDEVNGQKVTTLSDFRAAVKASKKASFLTVKTKEEYSFGVMTLEDILKDEDRLVAAYFYKKSELFKDLM